MVDEGGGRMLAVAVAVALLVAVVTAIDDEAGGDGEVVPISPSPQANDAPAATMATKASRH